MIINIFKLMGTIMVDSDKAENSISKTGDKADGMGKKLGAGIKTAAKFGAALVAGAAIGAAAIFALGVKLGNTADELLDLNSITGMSTTNIQKWRKVSEVAGVSADSMTNASQKLTKSLDTMSTGTGKSAESLERLGLSFDEIESMSADERMDVLTQALAGVEDKTERARIGTDLFGGSWKEIAPVVDLGTEAMNEAKDAANIISEDDLKKANDFRVKVADMKDQLSFFVTEITIAVMPTLSAMMDWFSGKMPLIKDVSEKAFNAIRETIEKVSDFINNSVMPVLQDLWAWIEPNIPAIKEAFETAFSAIKEALSIFIDTIKDATKWAKDHWNIVEPILIGIAAGAITFGVITTAIALYGAVTKGITAIQLLFNAALAMNPIGLVVIAVGLLVAAGVLLYKNWDVIVAKVKELFTAIKTKFDEIKNAVVNKVNEIKTAISTKFNEIKTAAVTKFNEVKDAILNPINKARDGVKLAVDRIKGFFTGMKLSLPKIKVPTFKLENWSINPVNWIKNMPKLSVNWNAQGGIFNKPTVFNTANAGLQGVGEAGAEAIIPLKDDVLAKIGEKISDTMEKGQGYSKQPIILQTILNGRVIAEEIHGDISELMGGRTNLNFSMKGV